MPETDLCRPKHRWPRRTLSDVKWKRVQSLVDTNLLQLERFLREPHPERKLLGALELDQAEELALYLADIGIPPEVYAPLGIALEPFFGGAYWVRITTTE